ncbi:cytochrome c-type biogenesis CcmF C-terminal domain-containing protein [Chloroflexota bacterium]
MAELGIAALVLAFIASLYAAYAFLSARYKWNAWVAASAGGSLYGVCGFVSLAVLVLLIAILTHQFNFEYVASYTSSDMSLPYLVSSIWAGNAGSLLFWAWALAISLVVLFRRRRSVSEYVFPYAASLTAIITAFFVLLLLTVASPFGQLPVVPIEGSGMNPLLENPGMIFHPPALLAGYVLLAVPFALALGALMSAKPGVEWLGLARKWALGAWLFLGVGNVIGAWWAYVELGWGGYWAWDPVENAGLMPWLIITAFLHSILMQKRKHLHKTWSMVLIILAFNLAIFGTFLTRSGLLSSVHTFGNTGLEPFFFIFLNLTFWGSWILLYKRRSLLKEQGQVDAILSKEGTFEISNLLLLGATLVVFLGTIFPAISEAITGNAIEVGQSFFNQVIGPVFLALILLLGICSVIGWQGRASGRDLFKRTLWPLVGSIFVIALLLILGVNSWYALAAYFLSSFAVLTVIVVWAKEVKARHRSRGDNYFRAFGTLLKNGRVHYGAYVVHIGIVLMAVGVIGSSLFGVEKEGALLPGQSMSLDDYTLTFQGITQDETPSKIIVTAVAEVARNGRAVTELMPQKIFHRSFEQPVSEVAIRTTPAEDLYVILAGWDADGTVIFQVLIIPLVIWIWIGGCLLALGGLMAFWPGKGLDEVQVAAGNNIVNTEDEIEQKIMQRRNKDIRRCRKCGTAVKSGDKFCQDCGARLTF